MTLVPASKSPRHATGALLRAHLSAATGLPHASRWCAVCHRLRRLAMEAPSTPSAALGEQPGPAATPSAGPRACAPRGAERDVTPDAPGERGAGATGEPGEAGARDGAPAPL